MCLNRRRCVFSSRRETLQLPLGGLRQKVCAFRRTLPAPADAHRREEVCVQRVRAALHAQRPPDETRPPPHHHQAAVVVAHRNAGPQQNAAAQDPGQDLSASCGHAGAQPELTNSLKKPSIKDYKAIRWGILVKIHPSLAVVCKSFPAVSVSPLGTVLFL